MSRFPSLFPPAGPSLVQGMERLHGEIKKAYPLKAKHRSMLPGTVRRLSAFLTVERENLPRDYMTRPEYLGAYLNYFLPWNIYRQGRLLQGLDLSLPEGARILDLGAGPLTFLHSLHLSRPHLRERSLEYIGVDRSEPAMKLGRKIYAGMATDNSAVWQVHTSRVLSEKGRPRADLLVAANFVNEIPMGRRGVDPASEVQSAEDGLLERWEGQVAENGAILLIEPAMRAASRKVARIRQTALARGWKVAAPCPHQGDCPMPGVRGGPWCHFNFRPHGAPDWLMKFSRDCRLPKERGSLSFLLLVRGDDCPVKIAAPKSKESGIISVRSISEPFDLPEWQQGNYGCSEKGLVLLQDRKENVERATSGASSSGASSSGPQPGDLLQAPWPDRPQKDRKSGAWILPRSR